MPTPAMPTLHHEKFMQRHPPRPQLQSQHSNSVPSTPYQQPRDIRFHSRSPSPNRGLGSQSPRSVASEAVGQGQNGSQRVLPQALNVCKFETGAEFRKRRIPYVDGGDQELGPPAKEPKKSLDPQEESKLSGDMRELYDRLLPSEESDARRAALIKKLERIMKDEWPESDIEVSVFGSSGNLLSSDDSDVDICVTTSLKKLESMHSLATLLHNRGMDKVVCRAVAKVPIVKCWDPELELACDINVNNPLALENTRMIRTYVQLDDRVRPLAKIIKFWTKRRLLNDAAYGGTISSYTWICMIFSFLQRRNPPILPSLQKMSNDKRSVVNGKLSPFADDVDAIRSRGNDNKESLAELLFGFFRHYGYEFPYSTSVVSIREGRMVSRNEKGWDDYVVNKEARCRLCVEEPFNTERNLGNSADDYAWNGIHREIRRAFELLADGCQLDLCCEQFVFPPDPEKTTFQRPPPKPKPTLTRSASQSGGRQNQEQNPSTRKKGGNRNQSAQRSGNRRASSGSAFNNQRGGYVQSPPVGMNAVDYFAAKGNLHDHLYQQYQFLQAQQDALRSQLAAQQHNNQTQRAGDLAGVGSPHIRTQFANGTLGSPRYNSVDVGPQTAPLFPGYMLPYPPRFAPATLAQHNQRSREGTNTNPSSPSHVAAVPALRRQGQRASEPAPSSSSIRSQSQPGRSFPHPLLVQQLAQQGYDMQALGLGNGYQNLRSPQGFGHAHQGGMQMSFHNMSNMQHGSTDSAMPKEYVGYYVGQSPQLGPQYSTASHIPPMPAMPLGEPPQRQRRVTPDLMPPTANGRHSSRSPSPLSNARGAVAGDLASSRSQGAMYSSSSYDSSPASESVHAQAAGDGGPIIVNGSNPPPQPRQSMNGFSKSPLAHASESMYAHPLPLRTTDFNGQDVDARTERRPSSPAVSPTTCRTSTARLPQTANGHASSQGESMLDGLPLSAAPLLSPVAELRTPSPSKNFDTFDSPQQAQINGIVKGARPVTARQPQRDENDKPKSSEPAKGMSKATPTGLGIGNGSSNRQSAPKGSTQPSQSQTMISNGQKNEWQQAPGRKAHKKSKSTSAGQPRSPKVHGGETMPANENERKGG